MHKVLHKKENIRKDKFVYELKKQTSGIRHSCLHNDKVSIIIMNMLTKVRKKPSSWQIIALGYLLVILLGSLLLSTPIASKARVWTPYIDAIFTSTSATCVTGLGIYDIFTYWSLFGQVVIILLVQIGGIGFMTIISLFAMITKRQIGLYERTILINTARTINTSGIVKLIKKIVIGTLMFELLGAMLLSIRFIPEMGFVKGSYYAVFHAISAFCNAGFDLMGYKGQFSSLTSYYNDPLVSITIMALIVIGGLGFLVWSDIWESHFKAKKFQWYTKIVLTATVILIIVPAILFMIFEANNLLKNMNFGSALLASLFQVISPRTAGFYTVNIAGMSESSTIMTMFLMFVGGSSGSTAGGIKIGTFVIVLFALKSLINPQKGVIIGKKRVDEGVLRQALAIFSSYWFAIFLAVIVICALEPFSLKNVTFEVISAIGTVGQSLGITPYLGVGSKIIITFLMYLGKVGLMTVVLAFTQKRTNLPTQRPIGDILIG